MNIDKYIEKLMRNQNINAIDSQKDIFSKSEFYDLLKPVVSLLNEHPDYTMKEYRDSLYDNSGIKEVLKDFVLNKKSIPGLNVVYGTENYKEFITMGNKQEVELKNDEIKENLKSNKVDTIYDLASTSKLFSSLAIMKLCEDGILNLSDEITKYAPQFSNLKGISIFDLLSFKVPLQTNGRLDVVSSMEEVERMLFDIKVGEYKEKSYTDMGAMVLKYVVESAINMPFMEFIEKEITNPLEMKDTNTLVNKFNLERVAPTNFDAKILATGEVNISVDPLIGLPYDPKARIFYTEGTIFAGHAGLFSTAEDMSRLARAIMKRRLVNEKSLIEMSKVRNPNESQFHGLLTYAKNPIRTNTEVYYSLSAMTLSSPGWCGTSFITDPINRIFMFSATNRSHNRITFVNKEKENILIESNDQKYIILPHGQKIIDSRKYAYAKDENIRDYIMKLTMQYKMLEDFLGYQKEEENYRTII